MIMTNKSQDFNRVLRSKDEGSHTSTSPICLHGVVLS